MAETITIVGNVGSEPQLTVTPTGLSITKFRVGCTHRAFDSATQQWVDKYTNWYHVSTFRQLAEHAHASIKLGDSVIVTGRVIQRHWEAGGRNGTVIDLDADAVGHDLRWGTASWVRKSKSQAARDAEGAERDAAEVPASDAASPIDEQGWSVPGSAEGAAPAS